MSAEEEKLKRQIDELRKLTSSRRKELARMARALRDVRIKPATDPEWLGYQKAIQEKQARLHELSVKAGKVVTAKGGPHKDVESEAHRMTQAYALSTLRSKLSFYKRLPKQDEDTRFRVRVFTRALEIKEKSGEVGGARARKKASRKVAKKKTRKKAKVGRGCSTRAGEMFALERNELPDKAFGLPRERKYPLYRIVGGKALADKEHAANAKARALQQLGKSITGDEYAKIVAKADRVIRLCDVAAVRRRRAAKRKKTAKKSNPHNPKKKKARKKSSSPIRFKVLRGEWSGAGGRGDLGKYEPLEVGGYTPSQNPEAESPAYLMERGFWFEAFKVYHRNQYLGRTDTLSGAKRKVMAHYRKGSS